MPLYRGPLFAKCLLSLNALCGDRGRRIDPLHAALLLRPWLTPLIVTLGLGGFGCLQAQTLTPNTAPTSSEAALTSPSSPRANAALGESTNNSNSTATPNTNTNTNTNLNEESSTKGLHTNEPSMPKIQSSATPNAGAAATASNISVPSHPLWVDLTGTQQLALQPLNVLWSSMTASQKRKWIALVANFSNLSSSDQDKLQQRMHQWASMSAQERAQARVVFAQVQQLSGDERLSKWQAYQALEQSEKIELAKATTKLPNSAAISPSPLSQRSAISIQMLFPTTYSSTRLDTDQLSIKTLLPPRVQAPAP